MLNRRPSDNTDQRDTEALILDTIKSAVRFQKNVGDAWIKVGLWLMHKLTIWLLKLEPCHEKTNILVSELVRHKPGYAVTDDG